MTKPTYKLRRVPNVAYERTRYAVYADEHEVGQVWSEIHHNEERRNWRSGMSPYYVDVLYWTHGLADGEVFETRSEAVQQLLREMGR